MSCRCTVLMAQAKRIYTLMIQVKNLFSLFFFFFFLKEIENMFSVFLSHYRHTHESLGESGKGVKALTLMARVPTAFLVLQNFHLCFYNSIETWYMFSTS